MEIVQPVAISGIQDGNLGCAVFPDLRFGPGDNALYLPVGDIISPFFHRCSVLGLKYVYAGFDEKQLGVLLAACRSDRKIPSVVTLYYGNVIPDKIPSNILHTLQI
ncbi:hypothetical protein [Alistipes putredinis]|uniref:hypothetical protein n=1 Tax=Alistipes putredinis TaxID=28117 RepID=UPI003AB7A0EB